MHSCFLSLEFNGVHYRFCPQDGGPSGCFSFVGQSKKCVGGCNVYLVSKRDVLQLSGCHEPAVVTDHRWTFADRII